MTANAINGPSVLETGHNTNILRALSINERNRVFTGPIKSERKPQPRRPTADEKLNPATIPAPADDERPREFAYRGRKNGGTKRGKVPILPARNMIAN